MNNKKIYENVKLKIAISNFEEEEKLKMRRTNKNIFKVVSVACVAIISITGVAFAKDIGNFIKNLFGKNTSDGVDIAVNNGYVAELETEVQSAEGIEISVASLIMDDFNFAMNFNLTLDEKYDIDEFDGVQFDDLKIVDEIGKTVFVMPEYDTELEYKGAYSFLANKKDEKNLTVSLSATGSSETFPKSKHLTVTFTKLTTSKLVYIDNVEQKERRTHQGNWQFEVEVPEEFYNRETTIYKAKSCSDNSIDINRITATLSNTAFKISIPEIITDKVDYELLHTSTPKSIYDKIALQKEYVETNDGKKFETAQKSDGDGGYGVPSGENKIVDYHQTFNLTKYDATDNIKVHIFTNKGEEITIELEKSK